MSSDNSESHAIVQWFRDLVRPILQKTDADQAIDELDKQAQQIDVLKKNRSNLLPICLLGQAGVGKSTLVNTLIADADIVVPSGGGTGPLTANALRVTYGERPSFSVRYHSKKQLNETRFILEAIVDRQLKSDAETETEEVGERSEMPAISLDSEKERPIRTSEATSRARLLIAGSQTADRSNTYLVDAFRWIMGQESKYRSQFGKDDAERMRRIQVALNNGAKNSLLRCDSAKNPHFRTLLRDHACGFLAPLIMEMSIQWPSPLLKDSVELVDLPGIGILSDVYASITSEYLRNRAKAVMLIADSRGIRREDAELLRSSGFLSRLLHASDDPSADPVALIVVVVKIDDVAVENWINDKSQHNDKALKTKSEHFVEQVERCKVDIRQRLQEYLNEVWEVDTEGKRSVVQTLLENLQVFPVSAPQYRLHCSQDPDEDVRPFLKDVKSTNIIGLREAISAVAKKCLAERTRREEETVQRFFGQLRTRMEVLRAQRTEEQQEVEDVNRFKKNLDEFVAPLQREFDTRRGGFRNFLRNTIPMQIEAKVQTASNKALKGIKGDLRKLRDAHWKTLQAAVRREGTFLGERKINLPHDFALRFEEPVAEVWSREILVEVRRETREFARFQSEAVTQLLEWSRTQSIASSTRLLEALVDAVKQHRDQVNAVGKEAVDDLREKVRAELVQKIEGPIRRKCQKFVADDKAIGTGVRNRILELFEQLADEVVEAASDPAVRLLIERFKEVDKEILAAFRDHSEPLREAADALVQRREKGLQEVTAKVDGLCSEIDLALSVSPIKAAGA